MLELPTQKNTYWQWDSYTDDQGPHARAVTKVNSKEICIVWLMGSPCVTAFVKRPLHPFPKVSIVSIPHLQEWLETYLF
jgi:hypothetical protein